jgi:hypothetical protein
MFERGLGVEVGNAGQTTVNKQIMGFHLFDLPAVRLALVDRMAETSPCLAQRPHRIARGPSVRHGDGNWPGVDTLVA